MNIPINAKVACTDGACGRSGTRTGGGVSGGRVTGGRVTCGKGGGVSGGSTMFALVNSRVKLGDILQGLIVQSGNDAAIALDGLEDDGRNPSDAASGRGKLLERRCDRHRERRFDGRR